MKKFFALLLAAVMIVSLASCTNKNNVQKVEFTKGDTNGNIYTSEFAGITFTAPDGYEFYSDEMIAEFYGVATEYLALGEIDSIIYDMYCHNEDIQSSININFENLTELYGENLDEAAYLEKCMTSFSITFSSFGDIVLQSIKESTVEISGNELNCINMTLDNDGNEFFQTLIIKKVGGYMMTCTVAAYTQAELDNIISAIAVI